MVRSPVDILAYLSYPRICEYPLCMAGNDMLHCTACYFYRLGKQGILQQILRPRAALLHAWRTFRTVTEKGYAEMDEVQVLPLRISHILLYHVFHNALEYLSCIRRSASSRAENQAAVGIQSTVALGLSRDSVLRRCGTVRIRILQHNAHIYHTWLCDYDALQAALMVCLLSYGNHDAGNM